MLTLYQPEISSRECSGGDQGAIEPKTDDNDDNKDNDNDNNDADADNDDDG